MNQYQKTISHEEIQELEYELMKAFDDFTRENGLTYYLCGGTCLGAARHQDFIPWDDDVDLCMMRDDYDRMMDLVREDRAFGAHSNYRFVFPLDDNYAYPFVKIVNTDTVVFEKDIQERFFLGVWIDIFPMDVWPDSRFRRFMMLKKHAFYQEMNKICIAGNLTTLKKRVLAKVGRFLYRILFGKKDYKYWNQKILNLAKYTEGELVGDQMWPASGYRDLFRREVFDGEKTMLFRDRQFPVPYLTDEYLRQLYDDYMQMPDEKDRVIHDFKGYFKSTGNSDQ